MLQAKIKKLALFNLVHPVHLPTVWKHWMIASLCIIILTDGDHHNGVFSRPEPFLVFVFKDEGPRTQCFTAASVASHYAGTVVTQFARYVTAAAEAGVVDALHSTSVQVGRPLTAQFYHLRKTCLPLHRLKLTWKEYFHCATC